jgi:photosystem II cytochrome c550
MVIESTCSVETKNPTFLGRTMLKRYIWGAVASLYFAFQMAVGSASALELDEATRTVQLNAKGDQVVLTLKEITQGKKLFNYACAKCHQGGITKTNFNVTLGPKDLAGALPARDNIESLVAFMKEPMTYDGESSLAETHPGKSSADIFPEMRNLTDKDLYAIAGHILLQPKVQGKQWGGGKVYR